MQKKNILVSAFACSPPDTAGSGSGEALLGFNIVREMSRHHNVHVITQTDNRSALQSSDFCKFHYTHIPFLQFVRNNEFGRKIYYYFWQFAAYLKARKICKKQKFDLVHHATYANGWMPSFIGALLPLPFVWGPLGGGQKTPPAFYSGYSLSQLAEEFTRILAQTISMLDPFKAKCKRKAKAILSCNRETKKRFFSEQAAKVFFFPVTTLADSDAEFLAVPEKRPENDKFRLLMAGRMISLKGFDLGIRAFRSFSKASQDAELVVVGNGPEEKKLKKLSKGANIKFIPWIKRKELFKLMKLSDAFLFPSLRDGGGIVLVEAMAAGIPVVCFDLAGPGIVVDENSGIKVRAKSPGLAVNGLAAAMRKLYENPSFAKKLGSCAQKRAELFAWKNLSKRLLSIYERALASSSSSETNFPTRPFQE